MYKGIVIILVIIIIVFFLNYITQNFTKDTVIILEESLSKMRSVFLEENIDEDIIKDDIDSLFKEWYRRYDILAFYIEHDELEKVENDLTMVKSNIDVGSYEEGIEHIDTCIFLMKHIKAKEAFDLKNIF